MLPLLFLQACSTNSDSSDDILTDQRGTLVWGGSPATDGVGILFITADITYGAPGNREDYSEYFPEGENLSQIVADIKLTGITTVRGWGAEFAAIELLNITTVD